MSDDKYMHVANTNALTIEFYAYFQKIGCGLAYAVVWLYLLHSSCNQNN